MSKEPSYIYWLVVGALLTALFAAGVALKYIQVGEAGLQFNF